MVTVSVVSDLHLEARPLPLDAVLELSDGPTAEVLCLLGDIGDPASEAYGSFLAACAARYRTVLLLAGNNEYRNDVGRTMDQTEALIRSVIAPYDNVRFLQNDVHVVGDVCFLGTTLWSYIPDDPLPAEADAATASITKAHTAGAGAAAAPVIKDLARKAAQPVMLAPKPPVGATVPAPSPFVPAIGIEQGCSATESDCGSDGISAASAGLVVAVNPGAGSGEVAAEAVVTEVRSSDSSFSSAGSPSEAAAAAAALPAADALLERIASVVTTSTSSTPLGNETTHADRNASDITGGDADAAAPTAPSSSVSDGGARPALVSPPRSPNMSIPFVHSASRRLTDPSGDGRADRTQSVPSHGAFTLGAAFGSVTTTSSCRRHRRWLLRRTLSLSSLPPGAPCPPVWLQQEEGETVGDSESGSEGSGSSGGSSSRRGSESGSGSSSGESEIEGRESESGGESESASEGGRESATDGEGSVGFFGPGSGIGSVSSSGGAHSNGLSSSLRRPRSRSSSRRRAPAGSSAWRSLDCMEGSGLTHGSQAANAIAAAVPPAIIPPCAPTGTPAWESFGCMEGCGTGHESWPRRRTAGGLSQALSATKVSPSIPADAWNSLDCMEGSGATHGSEPGHQADDGAFAPPSSAQAAESAAAQSAAREARGAVAPHASSDGRAAAASQPTAAAVSVSTAVPAEAQAPAPPPSPASSTLTEHAGEASSHRRHPHHSHHHHRGRRSSPSGRAQSQQSHHSSRDQHPRSHSHGHHHHRSHSHGQHPHHHHQSHHGHSHHAHHSPAPAPPPKTIREYIAATSQDYRRIYDAPGGPPITPDATNARFAAALAFLLGAVPAARARGLAPVVLSHHAPSLRGTSRPHLSSHPATHAYASDLEPHLAGSGVAAWFCGHTHHNFDMTLPSGVRLASNQFGSQPQPVPGYSRSWVQSVGRSAGPGGPAAGPCPAREGGPGPEPLALPA